MPKPSIVLFDSLDGRYHDAEKEIKDLIYFEYCELWFNGEYAKSGARKIEVKTLNPSEPVPAEEYYRIEAVRIEDHAMIRITGNKKAYEYIIALPDSSRYTYFGFTGEHCIMSNMSLEREQEWKPEGFIPRIAEKISFINVPEGDIPNVQIDRYRSSSTAGIPVKDKMTLSFHTISHPTARLVWHCPFCVIFTSDDGTVTGNNYVEYALVRLDGETWQSGEAADNELIVSRSNFVGWDNWKKLNREGYDVSVCFERDGNTVITRTLNAGIEIKNTTTVKDMNSEIYVALTGDQCAITNIRIS